MKQRLSVDLDKWLHELLSQTAKKRSIKITKWVNRAILEKMIRDHDLKEILIK